MTSRALAITSRAVALYTAHAAYMGENFIPRKCRVAEFGETCYVETFGMIIFIILCRLVVTHFP